MVLRGAIAAVVAATGVVALGVAGPASATDEITTNAVGTYRAEYPWGPTTWIVTPCANSANQCVHVSEYGVGDTERKYPGFSADAYWQVGWWMIRGVPVPDGITCEDGSQHTVPMNYAWDAATGEGVRSYYDPGLCGDAYNGANEVTLTKIGPAPGTP